jgi:signal transduction histidine kinase
MDAAAVLLSEIATHGRADTMPTQRDQMIGIFGHDLRGLLNALTIHAELFLRRDGDKAVESARNVRLAVSQMDRLITSLLDYVRLKADKLKVVPRAVDASELLREAVEIFRPLAAVKSLALTLAIPDSPLRAKADRDRMFQVLSNLLSNAIKFSTAGNIIVQATTLGQELQITVRDEGPGIPEGDLERVFEGFCQLQESDTRGLGLGLYISRAIIEAHGGRIWATSRPGAGSTFAFTVPRSLSERAPSGSPETQPRSNGLTGTSPAFAGPNSSETNDWTRRVRDPHDDGPANRQGPKEVPC